MSVTLDASVWLSSLSPREPAHAASRRLINTLFATRVALHQPGLFVVEVCATIARRTRDRQLAIDAGRAVLRWPALLMYELDHAGAAEAADIAASHALRGADAVYVATARRAGAVLITLDDEISARGAGAIEVRTPAEWLRLYGPA